MNHAIACILIAIAVPTFGSGIGLAILDARPQAIFAFCATGAAIGLAVFLLTDR